MKLSKQDQKQFEIIAMHHHNGNKTIVQRLVTSWLRSSPSDTVFKKREAVLLSQLDGMLRMTAQERLTSRFIYRPRGK